MQTVCACHGARSEHFEEYTCALWCEMHLSCARYGVYAKVVPERSRAVAVTH